MRHHQRVAPDFFLGAMSPYAWMSAERIDDLIPSARWRPVFLGGLFAAAGRSSWALGETREQGMAECEARAQRYGLGVIRWPERWPTSDLHVARGMLFAERKDLLRPFALAAMRMAFREAADLGEMDAVLEAGSRSGIDERELGAALADPDVKQALRAATDGAHSRGVFGVPTVIVGDELFWGDDRLEQAAAVAGAVPT
jgi:2-hydroxychromene-2-carboxylate isomerase